MNSAYKVTALLPMKGHSERVPGKNIRPLHGKPLYHWTVASLLKSKYISNIVVDTDSEEIATNIKENFDDVIILDRPDAILGDYISMNDIINYDISQINGEHFMQTHSTNPLLTSNTIDSAIAFYFGNLNKYDSLFAVTKLQVRLYWEDGSAINHNPSEMLPSQHLPPIYEENSNLYVFSRQSFANADNRRIGLKPAMFEMDKLEAVDIDNEQDLEIAEALLRLKSPGKGQQAIDLT